jgi:hypothetical protein
LHGSRPPQCEALDEAALAVLYPLFTAAQDALGELAEAPERLQPA